MSPRKPRPKSPLLDRRKVKPKRLRGPVGAERDAQKLARRVMARLAPIAVKTVTDRTRRITTDAQEIDDLHRALAPLVDFAESEASKLIHKITSHNTRELGRSLGIRIPELSRRRSRALAGETVKSIRGIAGLLARSLAPLVGRSVKEGLRGEAFAKEIARRLKVTTKQAERIAVGQVIRVNSAITQERHTELGIEEYTWRAVDDGNARAWHKALNGTVQRYDSPPMGGGGGPKDHGHPGSADVCRCQAIPIIPKK